MTDAQLGVLVAALTAGLGSIAAVVRWSVSVITDAIKANTVAMIENSASNARLATKIDGMSGYIERRETPTPPPGSLATLPK